MLSISFVALGLVASPHMAQLRSQAPKMVAIGLDDARSDAATSVMGALVGASTCALAGAGLAAATSDGALAMLGSTGARIPPPRPALQAAPHSQACYSDCAFSAAISTTFLPLHRDRYHTPPPSPPPPHLSSYPPPPPPPAPAPSPRPQRHPRPTLTSPHRLAPQACSTRTSSSPTCWCRATTQATPRAMPCWLWRS